MLMQRVEIQVQINIKIPQTPMLMQHNQIKAQARGCGMQAIRTPRAHHERPSAELPCCRYASAA